MAKSKKKKFYRLISKNKMTIFCCFFISTLLYCVSYSYKPPKQNNIEVHTGYIQSFESNYSGGKGTSRWDYVILLNNQQFHLGPYGRANKEDFKLLQKLQNEKSKITIEVAERSVLSKIRSPAYSNMPTILSMRTDDQMCHSINLSFQYLVQIQSFYFLIFLFPLVTLLFVLRERWKSA